MGQERWVDSNTPYWREEELHIFVWSHITGHWWYSTLLTPLYMTLTLFDCLFTCLFADSGVGAGIDSYYEYLMKAYILLGDNVFLERFNIVSPLHQYLLCFSFFVASWNTFFLTDVAFNLVSSVHQYIFHNFWPPQHYSAIMKYISQPPLLLNVHMHNPTVSVRSWMDSLLAFFPGLQVRDPVFTFLSICHIFYHKYIL